MIRWGIDNVILDAYMSMNKIFSSDTQRQEYKFGLVKSILCYVELAIRSLSWSLHLWQDQLPASLDLVL